jgi:hypothetical protein
MQDRSMNTNRSQFSDGQGLSSFTLFESIVVVAITLADINPKVAGLQQRTGK